MRIAVLSAGSILVRNGEQEWLFGAPAGIGSTLKESGIAAPDFLLLTSMRAPGYGSFKDAVAVIREMPLIINNLKALPVQHKHGMDYAIETEDAKILFSERGDVSCKDVEGYDLAIIRNKHRADNFGSNVITWPWPDTEYDVTDHELFSINIETSLKIWGSMEDVPKHFKHMDSAALTLEQANHIAKVAMASGKDGEENWAIGVSAFKKSYHKDGDHWVKNKQSAEKEVTDPDVEKLAELVVENYSDGESLSEGCMGVEELKDLDAGTKVDVCMNVLGALGNEQDQETDSSENVDKEWTNIGPVQRVGDILVSAIHRSFTVEADTLYALGWFDEDERIQLSNAIGDALGKFRDAADEKVLDRPYSGAMLVGTTSLQLPEALKEMVPEAPDQIDDTWTTVFKDVEGIDRWACITAVSMWDRQKEFIPAQAMDWALSFSKVVGRGPLH